MTDIYTQENGSKKKFLAPVLVILLCMVSLTAAGYAYSATVTNTDDDVIVDGLTMELYDTAQTPALVTGAMYSVDDIHIGTHTTNGYALKYGANGFYADPSQHDDATFGPQGQAAIADDFKQGYYVEVFKGEAANAVGVNAAPTSADFANAAAITAAVAAHKMIDLETAYTLKVNNQVQDDSKNVKISFVAKWDNANFEAFAGLNGVYVVVKEANGTVHYEQVGTDSAAAEITLDAAAGETSYTIEAYVSLTDFYALNAPAGNDGFFNEKFTVAFTAETVAA